MSESMAEIFSTKGAVIVAEIGLNHNGNFATAEKMINSAAVSGAHAVKFQTYNPELMYSVYTKAILEKGFEEKEDRSIIDFFAKFCFSREQYVLLQNIAKKCRVEFFSAPFDIESVDLLESIGVRLYKIASSEVTHSRLLERVSLTEKPVYMSTGMTHSGEIAAAIKILSKGVSDISLMHCVSLYPVPVEQLNLSRIDTLKGKFGLPVGFSDHTPDIEYSIAALYAGASVIEKHYTLGRDFECPDGNISVTSSQLAELRKQSELISVIRGDGKISFKCDEEKVAKSARRSLFASRDLSAGEVIQSDSFIEKRPGVGIGASEYLEILGKKCIKPVKKDAMILKENLSN